MDELIDLIKLQASKLENKALDLRLYFPEDTDRQRQVLEKTTEKELILSSISDIEDLLNNFSTNLLKFKAEVEGKVPELTVTINGKTFTVESKTFDLAE